MSKSEVPTKLLTPRFLILIASGFAYFASAGALFPVVPLYVEGPLGGNRFDVGLVIGSFSLSSILLRPLSGRFGDQRGRKQLLVAGAAVVGVTTLAYHFATSISILVALRLLNGAGEAFFFTGAIAMATDLAPPGRSGEAVSLFSVSLYGGLTAGPFVGEAILQSSGFTPVWIVSGALSLAAALFALGLAETRVPGERERQQLIHRKGLVTGVIMAASVWGFAGFSSFIPLYAPIAGLDGSRFLFGEYAAIILCIRLLGAKIPDRVGPRRSAVISLVTSAIGLAVIGSYARPAALFGGTVLLAIGRALDFPALVGMTVGRVPERQRATVLATFTAFIDLAFGVGPVSLGLVAQQLGLQAVFIASAFVAVAGLIVLLAATPWARSAPG